MEVVNFGILNLILDYIESNTVVYYLTNNKHRYQWSSTDWDQEAFGKLN